MLGPSRACALLFWRTPMGEVAQLAEHATENRGVGSSILPLATAHTNEKRAPKRPPSKPGLFSPTT
jgi:hypothetical protein